jgi:hypothetical protein
LARRRCWLGPRSPVELQRWPGACFPASRIVGQRHAFRIQTIHVESVRVDNHRIFGKVDAQDRCIFGEPGDVAGAHGQ